MTWSKLWIDVLNDPGLLLDTLRQTNTMDTDHFLFNSYFEIIRGYIPWFFRVHSCERDQQLSCSAQRNETAVLWHKTAMVRQFSSFFLRFPWTFEDLLYRVLPAEIFIARFNSSPAARIPVHVPIKSVTQNWILVGGLNPSEKSFWSVGIILPNIWETYENTCSSHHQPDLICWGYHLSKIRDFDRISRIRSIFCCISWLGSHMYESLVWGTRNSIFLSKSPRTLNFPWFSHVFPWFSFFVSPWFLLHFFWIYSDWAEQHHWAWSHPNSMCHAASTLGSVPSLDQRQLRS